jgi:tripartite-type tricarboxylate transporter receptor subunit TctC
MLLSPASTAAGNYFLYRNRLFDPLKDFAPVTTLERSPFVVAVEPSRPFKTMADLAAFIKSKGGDARYGLGSSTALGATALYLSRAGLTATSIPYKSIIEALGDLAAGELDFTLADTPIAVGQSKSGRIRLLAVTSADRSPALPDVPTLAESGQPGFDFTAWWGAYVPAGTPPEIVAKLEGWLNEAVASAETKKFLEEGGATPLPGSAKLLRQMLENEMDKWREIVRVAKIEPQ